MNLNEEEPGDERLLKQSGRVAGKRKWGCGAGVVGEGVRECCRDYRYLLNVNAVFYIDISVNAG